MENFQQNNSLQIMFSNIHYKRNFYNVVSSPTVQAPWKSSWNPHQDGKDKDIHPHIEHINKCDSYMFNMSDHLI